MTPDALVPSMGRKGRHLGGTPNVGTFLVRSGCTRRFEAFRRHTLEVRN